MAGVPGGCQTHPSLHGSRSFSLEEAPTAAPAPPGRSCGRHANLRNCCFWGCPRQVCGGGQGSNLVSLVS
jgi:hypothetical protein